MNIFGQILDQREDDQARPARDGDAEVLLWLNKGVTPEARLISFDKWIRRELAVRIDWSWAGAQRERRIEQARIYLERLVLGLWRRGWMLDGRRLARHLEGVLGNIGTYQKTGKVKVFWPYFQTCVDRYVGANAEELKVEAMSAGAHVGQVISALLGQKPAAGPTLPELLAQRADEISKAKAETLRGKLARERDRQRACKGDAQQPQLF